MKTTTLDETPWLRLEVLIYLFNDIYVAFFKAF